MRGRVRRRDLLRRDFMGFMLNGFMLGSLCVYVGNCSRYHIYIQMIIADMGCLTSHLLFIILARTPPLVCSPLSCSHNNHIRLPDPV